MNMYVVYYIHQGDTCHSIEVADSVDDAIRQVQYDLPNCRVTEVWVMNLVRSIA